MAAFYVECLVGFTVNMIILAAYIMKWKSLRSLKDRDKIISSLTIFRALYFSCSIVENSVLRFSPWLLKTNIVISFLFIQGTFVFYSSHWLATVLCVFYCVKIVTYNYKLFIFLKTRISIMVPWFILASLLIALISSLPVGWYCYDLKLQNVSNCSNGNITRFIIVPDFDNMFLIFAVGSFPPFVICFVTIALLIHFLLIHTRRMRSNESHIQTPNLKSHFGALKSMSLFLLLQIVYFICLHLITSGRVFHSKFPFLDSWVILCSLQLLHSLHMISSSKEVKKMFT
ncbi:taste receptor type 2 member 40-like [Hyla sarda]|uniref:taste receptor type 2 member 40-like n=1 Tax=Hyla sarda TaxID=327740 RepID=UPI0024C339A8|nr:taste receptor type 2 member 40-like [Hyla sarda]